jgi:hypothetical protein
MKDDGDRKQDGKNREGSEKSTTLSLFAFKRVHRADTTSGRAWSWRNRSPAAAASSRMVAVVVFTTEPPSLSRAVTVTIKLPALMNVWAVETLNSPGERDVNTVSTCRKDMKRVQLIGKRKHGPNRVL